MTDNRGATNQNGKADRRSLTKGSQKMLSAKKNKAPKIYKGKQTLKHLMKQNTGVSSMEITDAKIKAFEPIAKKYGLDYSLKKVKGEDPLVSCFLQRVGRGRYDGSL
jgi:hypothetical protein